MFRRKRSGTAEPVVPGTGTDERVPRHAPVAIGDDAPAVVIDELRAAFGGQLSGDVVVHRRPEPLDEQFRDRSGEGHDDSGDGSGDGGGDGGGDEEGEVLAERPVPPVPPVTARESRATVVIGGDDLPDAVYLDGELDRTGPVPRPGSDYDTADLPREVPVPAPIPAYSGPDARRARPGGRSARRAAGRATGPSTGRAEGAARTTIVIGDDVEASGVYDAVPAPNASMDPRVRARRAAVKKAAHRKRMWWAIGVSLVLLLAVGTLAVLASSWFSVDRVIVQGGTYTEARNGDELALVVESLRGEPVLLVDTIDAEQRLEAIAWVERAFVTTRFPDTVLIDLRERVPLATFAGADGRYRVIDRDGRVLDVIDGRPVDYALIVGAGPDAEPGGFAGPVFAAGAQLSAALPAEIAELTSAVTVDAASGDLGLVLAGPDGDVTVRFGDVNQLDAKLARLLQQVREGLDGVVSIDVSTDDVSVRSS
jgi:cell division protein FtsQ